MNLSIVVGGKSFWYYFDDDSWKEIVDGIVHYSMPDPNWIKVKDDYFRVREVQAVLHWKSEP